MSHVEIQLRKFKHPGTSRRKGLRQLKGRQVDPAALDEIRALLGERPRRRDLLVEHLHLIQDRYRHISPAHLAALADEMHLSLAEVFETATFYAHFDVLGEGQIPPPPVTVRVCDSLTCEMMGADRLLARLGDSLGPEARVLRAPCMGRCAGAPVAAVGHRYVENATPTDVIQCVKNRHTEPLPVSYKDYDEYTKDSGYQLLNSCMTGKRTVEELIAIMEASGLRGLGGAGFPAGRKWRLVRAQPAPRLLAINADEGEPGTFKDRYFLERDPHRFLEGMLIAAWAIEAGEVYIYLRDEYSGLREMLGREIARLEAAGRNGGIEIHLRRGAGAYICGEESAMLESLEGKRGEPRHKPPYPAQVGLFGRPTLIHNVETVYWVRELVENGAEWFAGQGRHGRQGLRSFSVSGRVREPGVKVAPAGITARELIDEYCGGMAEGHAFKAYLPGGASGGILPAAMADIPLDFGTLEAEGCFIGSAAVIVLSEHDEIKRVALNLMRFFEDESCGQCTPCRVGTEKAAKLMERADWDAALLGELARTMMDASICGLGQAAPNPLLTVLKHFKEELT